MNSQFLPARRSSHDFSQTAFSIAPNQSDTGYIGSGPPGQPHPRPYCWRKALPASHLELGLLDGFVAAERSSLTQLRGMICLPASGICPDRLERPAYRGARY
jgi:hypothetical protein